MPSLVEAVASLAVSALIFSLLTAAMSAQARLQASLVELAGELFSARQLEQLADRAVLAAGAGPAHPAAVVSVDSANVVLASDANGDGTVATSGSETTAIELRSDAGAVRVRVRFGRQTMTVMELDDTEASFEARDAHGATSAAATTTLVSMTLRAREGGTRPKVLLFALPQRLAP